MRRFSIVVLFIMIITFVFSALDVHAEETTQVMVELNDITIVQGQGGTMSLSLLSNVPYSAFEINVYFDTNYFSVSSLSMSSLFDSYTHQKDAYISQDGYVSFIFITEQNITSNGNILSIYFSAASQTPVDQYPVYVAVNGFINDQYQSIPVQTDHGSITVSEAQTTIQHVSYYDSLSSTNIKIGQQTKWTIRSYSMYALAASNYEIYYPKDKLSLVSVQLGAELINQNVIMEYNAQTQGYINIAILKIDGMSYASPLFEITFEAILDGDVTDTIRFIPKNSVNADFVALAGNEINRNFSITKTPIEVTNPIIELSDYTGGTSETIYVDVLIDATSDLAAGDFIITYDPNFVIYQGYEILYQQGYLIINDQRSPSEISFSFIESEGISSDVRLLRLSFLPKESIESQGTISIVGTNTVNSLLETVLIDYNSATITLKESFTVIFKDYDGSIISQQNVANGSVPVEPTVPIREGTTFIGWDDDLLAVTTDTTYQAIYQLNIETLAYENLTLIYDGSFHMIDASGLPLGASAKYIDVAVRDVGEYTMTVEYYLDGIYQGFDQAILNIQPKPIDITIHNQEMTEKMATPIFTYEVVGLVPDDNLGITFNAETSTVGNHVITATISNRNYVATITTGTITVLPFPYAMGDVSKDDKISIIDVALLQLHVAQLITLDDYQIVAGDINGDKSITLLDIARLQLSIANLAPLN